MVFEICPCQPSLTPLRGVFAFTFPAIAPGRVTNATHTTPRMLTPPHEKALVLQRGGVDYWLRHIFAEASVEPECFLMRPNNFRIVECDNSYRALWTYVDTSHTDPSFKPWRHGYIEQPSSGSRTRAYDMEQLIVAPKSLPLVFSLHRWLLTMTCLSRCSTILRKVCISWRTTDCYVVATPHIPQASARRHSFARFVVVFSCFPFLRSIMGNGRFEICAFYQLVVAAHLAIAV